MRNLTNISKWLVAVAVVIAGFSGLAKAANPEYLDVKVSISATKSVSAGTTYYDFGGLNTSISSNSATALVITNDSGSLVETYTMLAGNAVSDTGGTNWTLAGSPGSDIYSLAAQFSTARPDNVGGTWASDDLTAGAQTCSATLFGNGTAGESGVDVSPTGGSNTRNLWFRIQTPTAVTDATSHTATITLAVQ